MAKESEGKKHFPKVTLDNYFTTQEERDEEKLEKKSVQGAKKAYQIAKATAKITEIQNSTEHDEYEISGSRAEWKDVLAVYVAKVSNGDDTVQMITLDDDKVNTLKEIFWAMNEISSSTEEKEVYAKKSNGRTYE